MREIKVLTDEVREELKGAKHYTQMFQKYKNENMVYAKKYNEMAEDELKHALYLHDIIVSKIKAMKNAGTEIPDLLMELWDDEHNNYIEETTKIKMMLSI